MKKVLCLGLIFLFILTSNLFAAGALDITITPEAILGGTVLIPGSTDQKIGAVELVANTDVFINSFGLSINNPGIQSLKIVDQTGRQFGYIQGIVSPGQIYRFYAPNGNYPAKMLAREHRIFKFYADVKLDCTGVVQLRLEELGAVTGLGITANCSPLPITLPGINVGSAGLNITLSPLAQSNLVLGGYNMAGKFILSVVNGDVRVDQIVVKMEGDIFNINNISLKSGATTIGSIPALDINGTAFFIVNWIVPKNTSPGLEIQFMATDRYSGGLTATVANISAHDETGGKVEVRGLPCKAMPLAPPTPDRTSLLCQIAVLQAQLLTLGNKNPELAGQIKAQLKAMVSTYTAYFPYAEMSVSLKEKKTCSTLPLNLDRSNVPIVNPRNIVGIKFCRFSGFSFNSFIVDEFGRYVEPAKKPALKYLKQTSYYVELEVVEGNKPGTAVSFIFNGAPPLIWQGWVVASGLIVIDQKNEKGAKGAPPANGSLRGVAATWGALK